MDDSGSIRVDDHIVAESSGATLRDEAVRALRGSPKVLSPSWLYDDRGSELFDEITRLDEYYPTEAERSILQAHAADIAVATGVDTIVELGSGTSDKTRTLLDAFHELGTLRRFVPVDVSRATLVDAEEQPLVGAQDIGERAEEGAPLLDEQVADRATEERHEAPALPGQVVEVSGEVTDDGVDVDALVPARQRGGRFDQRRATDIHGHETAEGATCAVRVEQGCRLVAGPRAKLDNGVRAGRRGDLIGVGAQDRALRLGRVIHAEPGDLVEQRTAPVVVQPARRQDPRRALQGASGFGAHR